MKNGAWHKASKGRYRFTSDKLEKEELRESSLGQALYDEITMGPREQKLRLRWQAMTGLQKRDPLPRIDPLVEKPRQGGATSGEKSEWLSFPGLPIRSQLTLDST